MDACPICGADHATCVGEDGPWVGRAIDIDEMEVFPVATLGRYADARGNLFSASEAYAKAQGWTPYNPATAPVAVAEPEPDVPSRVSERRRAAALAAQHQQEGEDEDEVRDEPIEDDEPDVKAGVVRAPAPPEEKRGEAAPPEDKSVHGPPATK